MTGYLPDVNVLVALSLEGHPHGIAARTWFEQQNSPCLRVCRVVQLGFLRILTIEAAAGSGTLSNRRAWALQSKLTRHGLVEFVAEPASLDDYFVDRVLLERSSPKRWNDAYLSAFSEASGLRLVTFDRALASYTRHSILLHA